MIVAIGCARPLSASNCITSWNEHGHLDVIVAEGYVVADVNVGKNKVEEWGCGALFHSAPGRPWRVYGGVLRGDTVLHWDTQTGSSWTVDSPEGPIDATVRVRSDGSLAHP